MPMSVETTSGSEAITRREHQISMANVATQFDALGNAVNKLTDLMGKQNESLNTLTTNQASQGKIPVGILISLVALVLTTVAVSTTIITVVGSMAIGPIKTNISKIEESMESDNAREQRDSGAFAALQTLATTNTNAVRHLDDVLQREMRLLNTATDDKVDALIIAFSAFVAEHTTDARDAAYQRGYTDAEIKENSHELDIIWDYVIPGQYREGQQDEALRRKRERASNPQP